MKVWETDNTHRHTLSLSLHTHTNKHTHVHTNSYTHISHTYTHTYTHTLTHTHLHTHTYTHTHTLSLSHAYTHTYTQTHTHAHTHSLEDDPCLEKKTFFFSSEMWGTGKWEKGKVNIVFSPTIRLVLLLASCLFFFPETDLLSYWQIKCIRGTLRCRQKWIVGVMG